MRLRASRTLLRGAGALLVADGLSLLVGGRAYVQWWRARPALRSFDRAMARLAARPAWLLRLAGAAEASLGLATLARAPLSVPELYRVLAGVYNPLNLAWRQWLCPGPHLAFDQALSSSLPQDGRVLDLGCGTAANLERLLALGLPFGSYTGVDLSQDMLARARAAYGHLPNVRFAQLDLSRDPLPEGPFDLILSTWVFSHLPAPGRVAHQAFERLRPNGHAILLFLAETGSWLDWPARLTLGLFSSRPVAASVYRSLPGLVSLERFGGGTVALAVLRRPQASSQA